MDGRGGTGHLFGLAVSFIFYLHVMQNEKMLFE